MKHFVACYTVDRVHFDIYTFEITSKEFSEMLRQFNTHLNQIQIEPCLVIIEMQLSKAPLNHSIMFLVSQYFYQKNFEVSLQHPRLKYRCFKDNDERKNKQNSVMKVMNENLKNITIKYNGIKKRTVENHKYYSQELTQFLEENGLDKFDDISDTILMHFI